jgi:ribosomal protein L11 methylase PrmA
VHAGVQRRTASAGKSSPAGRMSRTAFLGLLDSLRDTVRGLNRREAETDWGEYYEDNNYTEASFRAKQRLTGEFLGRFGTGTVWDLGGNTGVFSRIAAEKGNHAVCFDNDYGAVEKNYREVKDRGEKHILPLVLDLTNPSSAIGWGHRERESLIQRGPADTILALALVHHLAIGNNVPLVRIAEFFARCGPRLIVEFIPKEDSQVRRMLSTRKDIFPEYTRAGFEAAFEKIFRISDSAPIPESARILYLMESR